MKARKNEKTIARQHDSTNYEKRWIYPIENSFKKN